MDRIVSCLALLFPVVAVAAGALIFGWQLLNWLQTEVWQPMPLDVVLGGLHNWASGWLGLQKVFSWILALPLSIVCGVIGFLVFWAGGVLSTYLYKRAAHAEAKPITPAQSHA